MNPQVPDELISAYFDGELSPEERSEVERLLSGNEESQRELNETARLSALLHSFPRETAPAELAANVLRQTDQMPLTAKSVKAGTRGVWRDWKAGLLGAAITSLAMCLIIAVSSMPVHESTKSSVAIEAHRDFASHSAMAPAAPKSEDSIAATEGRELPWRDATSPQSLGAELNSNKDMVASDLNAPSNSMSGTQPRARMSMERKSSGRQPALEMAPDAAVAAPAVAAIPEEPSEGQGIGINETGLTNEDFVKGLREGKVYVLAPQPADPDNNVAVVYLEVVDIDRSAEQMQVLLKKNSIAPRSFNKDGQPMPDDLVVMYVVASGDKLAKTLKDVDQHRDLFSNWTAQAPLQVAAVSDESGPEAAKKEGAGRGTPADKKSEAEKQGLSDADAEMPEVQIVLDAYVQRNGFVNSTMSNSAANSNAPTGGNRGGIENGQRQQIANLVREKSKEVANSRNGSLVEQQTQLRQSGRSEPGYDVVRLNNPILLNNDVAVGSSNTTQLNLPRMESARRQLAFNNPDKAGGSESSPRALRMLFVLHPQADGIPAAKPQ